MLLVLQQQMSCHIAHLITHLINLSPIVTVWDICTHTSQIGQKVFEAHTSHSQYLQKFNELGFGIQFSIRTHHCCIFLPRNTRQIQTLPKNLMANRTQQSCETDSPKCLRTTLTSRPVFTSEHTTLYTRQPGGLLRNRKFSVESKVLSWIPYGIHKAPFDITVTLNVCEGENSQIPKQSPMFFFHM